jgi:hypothetical protein
MIIEPISITNEHYLKFVEKNGSVFNQQAWLRIYSNELLVLGIFNLNKELIGCFNLYLKKALGLNYVVVPPYAPSNAFVLVNPAQNTANKIAFEKEVHNLIANYLVSMKVFLIYSAFPTFVNDMQVYFWDKFKVIPNYTYQLSLNSSLDELFNNITSEKRKSIRKAQKDNLEIKLCSDYTIVLSLINKTFERREKHIDKELVSKILFEFANDSNSFAYVAYQNGNPIACAFCVYYKTTSYYLLGGYDNDNKNHGAGPACIWQSIIKAKELGITTFDFEGSMLPEIEKYFREFGGQLVPYYTINKASFLIEVALKVKKRSSF